MEKAEGINMYYSGYEILKRSINNNELQECLRGNGKYRYQDKNDPGPVNQSIILDSIYKIYEKEPDVKIDILFQRSLCDMINSDVEGIYLAIYLAIYYLYEQIGNEVKGVSPFKIDRLLFKSKVIDAIKNNKIEIDNTNQLERLNVKGNILKRIYKINDFSIKKIWSFNFINRKYINKTNAINKVFSLESCFFATNVKNYS